MLDALDNKSTNRTTIAHRRVQLVSVNKAVQKSAHVFNIFPTIHIPNPYLRNGVFEFVVGARLFFKLI